jgi:hypothetical protein
MEGGNKMIGWIIAIFIIVLAINFVIFLVRLGTRAGRDLANYANPKPVRTTREHRLTPEEQEVRIAALKKEIAAKDEAAQWRAEHVPGSKEYRATHMEEQ